MGEELRFSPAGPGLAVSVYFGLSALASLPSGTLVEKLGPARRLKSSPAWSPDAEIVATGRKVQHATHSASGPASLVTIVPGSGRRPLTQAGPVAQAGH